MVPLKTFPLRSELSAFILKPEGKYSTLSKANAVAIHKYIKISQKKRFNWLNSVIWINLWRLLIFFTFYSDYYIRFYSKNKPITLNHYGNKIIQSIIEQKTSRLNPLLIFLSILLNKWNIIVNEGVWIIGVVIFFLFYSTHFRQAFIQLIF